MKFYSLHLELNYYRQRDRRAEYSEFMLVTTFSKFYVSLTVHINIILDNGQLDTHLLYFAIRLL